MDKTIKLNNGKKVIASIGDVIFVTIKPDDSSLLVRGRLVDVEDGKVIFSVLNPKLEPEKVIVFESRVVKIEKPN